MYDEETQQRPEEISLCQAQIDVITYRLKPYKGVKPNVINASKVNEMLNITLKNFMDGERVENMSRESLHYLCGSFRFLLFKSCPTAYAVDYNKFREFVKKQGTPVSRNSPDESVCKNYLYFFSFVFYI